MGKFSRKYTFFFQGFDAEIGTILSPNSEYYWWQLATVKIKEKERRWISIFTIISRLQKREKTLSARENILDTPSSSSMNFFAGTSTARAEQNESRKAKNETHNEMMKLPFLQHFRSRQRRVTKNAKICLEKIHIFQVCKNWKVLGAKKSILSETSRMGWEATNNFEASGISKPNMYLDYKYLLFGSDNPYEVCIWSIIRPYLPKNKKIFSVWYLIFDQKDV